VIFQKHLSLFDFYKLNLNKRPAKIIQMQTAVFLDSFYQTKKRLTFILLCLIAFLLLFTKKNFIEAETAAFEFLQDRPEGSFFQIINTLQYVSIPIIYLWKITVISFVIWVGCFTFGYRVTYSNCWTIALTAEFIFIIPELIKIFWFLFIETDPTFREVQVFYPFSALSLTDYESISTRYHYPLKALNIFEIGYWSLLVRGVHAFAKKEIKVAALIVACSYVLLFFLWLLFYIAVYN